MLKHYSHLLLTLAANVAFLRLPLLMYTNVHSATVLEKQRFRSGLAKVRTVLGVVCIVLCFVPFYAHAAVELPDDVGVKPPLTLVGEGDLKWLGMRVYHARLWSANSRWSAENPYALGIQYKMNFSREELVKTTLEEMSRIGGRSMESVQKWEADLEEAFPDVKKGETIVAYRTPAGATRFYHNGVFRYEIANKSFARDFFSIWLDADTQTKDLRKALLKGGA